MFQNFVASVLVVSVLTPLTSAIYEPREESKSPIELSNSIDSVSAESSTPSVGVVDKELMQKVCELVPTSPLCNNWELLKTFSDTAQKRNVPTWLIVGIAYAESDIGTNFHHTNRPDCRENTFNWYWAKARHDGIRGRNEWQKIWHGCYLYKFKSMEDGIQSIVNTIGVGYKGCLSKEKPIECISYAYVWAVDKPNPEWVQRVAKFIP